MNKLAWLLTAALLTAPAALAAQGFEGVIQQEVKSALPQAVSALAGADATNPGQVLDAILARLATADSTSVVTVRATIRVKGVRMRTDGALAAQGAPDGYAILDAGKATVYTIFPAQKTVGFATADAMAEVQKRLQAQAPPAEAPPTRTDLGIRVVNGVQAHGYRLTAPDGVAVVWVDPARKGTLAIFEALQRKLAGPNVGGLQKAVGDLGFPVLQQVVVKAPPLLGSGWLFSQMSVTSVKRESVSDDQFVVPADYRQVDLAKQMVGPS